MMRSGASSPPGSQGSRDHERGHGRVREHRDENERERLLGQHGPHPLGESAPVVGQRDVRPARVAAVHRPLGLAMPDEIDLALDGPGWRTPRHFVAETDELLAATRDHGLEGVVAKRLGSPYLPGARSGAWVKHKHRRIESFLVCGWSPRERRRPESLLLARVGSDGSLEAAGSVPLILANGGADDLRRELEPLVLPPTRRGQRIRRLAPEVRAVVAFHGPTRGPVRDPLLRALVPAEPPRAS